MLAGGTGKTKKCAFSEISPMFVYTFSPSALKNNIIDVKMLAAGTEKKNHLA